MGGHFGRNDFQGNQVCVVDCTVSIPGAEVATSFGQILKPKGGQETMKPNLCSATSASGISFICLTPLPASNPSPSTSFISTKSEVTPTAIGETVKTAPTPTDAQGASQTDGTQAIKTPGSKHKDGLSGGAVAGVAIGALIAGAVIAGIIFLFLLKRYRKRHQQQSAYTQHLPAYNPEAAKQEKPQVNVAQTTVAAVDTYLPQPAEDDAITGELSRIRDKIKNHTQSYYHTSPVNANANVVDQSKLQEIAVATGLSTSKLAELLLNPHSRMTAVRLYLAWVILSRCGTQRTGGSSFLPGEVSSFAAFLSGIDNGNAGKVALSSKWKAISGELLQGRYGQQPTDNASLEQSIGQAIAAADSVLAPFVNSSIEATSDKRLRNLDSIMRRAAQFAFLLFSQPSSFSLDWTAQGRIVAFPGLSQVVSEDGYACRPPRVFSEPEVVAGAGS